ncbi:BZIP transcription factor [Colletotrichum scovillei]|uniref:BZIP transcription factor n=1 Tax=Colletotrichum scovillei TaxID=1209932 RepID=A0A9P7R3C6_9PEZI|nr:BZIP transcription factor [Colletotrichum scovillei]KAF4775799.1 BZIP transcription factor [Colletotrichum scovillei]KAG7047773.1 BZIP transcription factor [Colletotrichum scovillei]KAG7060087.1 BZIP transcription factor [Colletotrichum scovillei]KAG7067539.1 BZIP transcription factor [Colletotrichum scovillei]
MASDAVNHPSPAGSVASSVTPGLNYSNNKRSAPDHPSPAGPGNAEVVTPAGAGTSPASQPPGDSNKKRRVGPGSRGVANLTPEQLAKKRANDREAQRAIRERTKNQIETLERRIQELTSQQPYQELQAVQRAKEAVEAENADLKRRLATFIASIQPLISASPPSQPPPPPADPHPAVFPSPSGSYSHVHQHNGPISAHNASTPNSAASPASIDPTAGWQTTPNGSGGGGGGPVSDLSPPNHMYAASKMLDQQRQGLRHGLDLGPERLGLDFLLLDQNARVGKIQSGVNGAQDTPSYNHVPMKHDWTGVGPVTHSRSPSLSGPTVHTPRSQVDYPQQQSQGQQQQQQHQPSSSAPPESRALGHHAAEVKNCGPTCPLDSLLLDFLHERRQRAADGLSTHEIIGPRYPSVLSLLNPANSKYSHPLSKVFTDILATFPDLSALPQRVAVLYIMFLIMRWQISPTRENYDRLPEWARPRPAQLLTEHPAWIDHVPFPAMRDKLCRDYNPREYLFDNFFVPFTTTLSLNWPYEETDTLLQVPESDEVLINPVFERHLRRLENWTLGQAFNQTFPKLRDTYNLKE